jgi:hypothetical protein
MTTSTLKHAVHITIKRQNNVLQTVNYDYVHNVNMHEIS